MLWCQLKDTYHHSMLSTNKAFIVVVFQNFLLTAKR